jgi:hypothetical protein
LDTKVFRLTQHSVDALALPIDILNADYRSGLSGISVSVNQPVVAFIAPP